MIPIAKWAVGEIPFFRHPFNVGHSPQIWIDYLAVLPVVLVASTAVCHAANTGCSPVNPGNVIDVRESLTPLSSKEHMTGCDGPAASANKTIDSLAGFRSPLDIRSRLVFCHSAWSTFCRRFRLALSILASACPVG